MPKSKKVGKKRPAKLPADQATEQIVRMIAESIGSLPAQERRAAMEAFDLTAEAISTRGKKASKSRKARAAGPSRKSRAKS